MNHQERVTHIKSQFRLYMDGTTAQSLRRKGCNNLVVWGVSLNHLQDIAREYTPDFDLSIRLWEADVRECKLLATMLMDVNKMDIQTTRQWMDQTTNEELAEMLVFNLVQHLPFAATLAREWSTSEKTIVRMSGFNLYARLFINGVKPEAEETKNFLSHAVRQLSDEHASVRRAAMNAIVHFSQMDDTCLHLAREATKGEGYDFP